MDSAVTGAIGGKTMAAAGESLGEGPTAPHPFAPAQISDSEPSAAGDVVAQAEESPSTAGESTED